MGAHGVSPFQDDDGAGFVADIVRAKDFRIVADAIYAVPDDESQYVETGTATRALIAGEVLALQRACECGDLPDDMQSWTEEYGDADPVLVSRAIRAIRRVLTDSALSESWKESRYGREWIQRVRGLLSRLGDK